MAGYDQAIIFLVTEAKKISWVRGSLKIEKEKEKRSLNTLLRL